MKKVDDGDGLSEMRREAIHNVMDMADGLIS